MPGSNHVRLLPSIRNYAIAKQHFESPKVRDEAWSSYWKRENDPETCVPLSTRYFPHYSLCRRDIPIDDKRVTVYSLKLYRTHLIAYFEPDEEGYELRIINRSWTTQTTNAFIWQMGWQDSVLTTNNELRRVITSGGQFLVPNTYRRLDTFGYHYADAMLAFDSTGRCNLERSLYKTTATPVLGKGMTRIARALLPYMHAAYVRKDYTTPALIDEFPKSMRLTFFNKVKTLLKSRKAGAKITLNSFEIETFLNRARFTLRAENAWEFNNDNLEEKLTECAERTLVALYSDVALKNDFAMHLPPSMMWGE